MKAIETVGTIDKNGNLFLEHLSLPPSVTVRVILLAPEEDDIHDVDWMRVMRGNPAFDFLKEPAEDIYGKTDGKPHHVA